MTLSVYLAARFSRLPELKGYADELTALGMICTSRWLLGGHEWVGTPDEEIPMDELATFAREDLEDLMAADVVVCFTEPARSAPARGGRHVEFGYALASGKPVIAVGPVENVFYALPQVIRCESWEEAVQLLTNAGPDMDARPASRADRLVAYVADLERAGVANAVIRRLQAKHLVAGDRP